MSVLAWVIVFSLIGGVLSVLAASVFLIIPEPTRTRSLPHMVSFAIGTLLGAAFLGLLPHALMAPESVEVHSVTLTVLVGILSFFLLEKLVIWRHCHSAECEIHGEGEIETHHHTQAAGSLVLIGDGVHNFVDGVLIAAAFLTDIHLGIVTAVAVAAHEIPQEVGDFAILLHSGYSRLKALLFNMLSSLATMVGALIAYFWLGSAQFLLPYILAIAAASFIYIAVADLIPGLHKKTAPRESIEQISLISLGVLIIYITHSTLH